MGRLDTSMGGPGGAAFPETTWSRITSSTLDPDERRRRLNEFCASYWRPVYRFIRSSWGKPVEDAKDLTQEFLSTLCDSEFLSRYDSSRGRFRTFLKSALRRFLSNDHRARNQQKRNPGPPLVSLDVEALEQDPALADSGVSGPEEAFDLQWAADLTSRALGALKKDLESSGRGRYFQVYEAYELKPASDRVTYGDVATRLGLDAGDVKNFLDFVRVRLQQIVLDLVKASVTTPDELRQEMEHLFPEG